MHMIHLYTYAHMHARAHKVSDLRLQPQIIILFQHEKENFFQIKFIQCPMSYSVLYHII
jgi:hypothetical protein